MVPTLRWEPRSAAGAQGRAAELDLTRAWVLPDERLRGQRAEKLRLYAG